MSGRTSGLLLLLLIMLNHAVMACDALVVHMPDHDHAFTSFTDNHNNTNGVADLTKHTSEYANERNTEHNTDQHSEHAHVTCYISFFQGIELLNFTDSAIISTNRSLNLISYRPPVPPPNV